MTITAGPRDPIQPRAISSPTAKKEDAMTAAVAEFNAALLRYNVPLTNGGDHDINAAVRAAIELRLAGPVRDTGAVDAKVLTAIDAFLHTHLENDNITNPGQISLSKVSAMVATGAGEVRNTLARSVTD